MSFGLKRPSAIVCYQSTWYLYLYLIEKVLDVLDAIQVLWVLVLVLELANFKSTCTWLKYFWKYLTPTLPSSHQVGTLLKRHMLVPVPTPPLHPFHEIKGAGKTVTTSPSGDSTAGGILACGGWHESLVFTALKCWVSKFWKSNTIKANARRFAVVSAIINTECLHTKFLHVRYVWFGESLQKHAKIHCQSPSRGLGSQQWSH